MADDVRVVIFIDTPAGRSAMVRYLAEHKGSTVDIDPSGLGFEVCAPLKPDEEGQANGVG